MHQLSSDDLVPDVPLGSVGAGSIGANDDLLHHRVLARRMAELAIASEGMVNIALFGPWGAGKSSFNALLREELRVLQPKTQHITFDAWKNSGPGFRTNFLYALADQVRADVKISEQLFQSTTSVRFPILNFGWKWWQVLLAVGALLATLFLGLPAGWSWAQIILGVRQQYGSLLAANVVGFAGMAAGGTLLLVVTLALFELSKVTVAQATPSHVAQFGQLFQAILDTKRKQRFVVFVDELDRCDPADVMSTLEGLRTFLGHPRCVFVVAFDREAVAGIIAEELKSSAPPASVAPYYRTSGEYLDKIFQFQLALPPQPVHTFRRLANSLVREREGVWGELRSHAPDLLERVVSILSPMHLASPRRTKVLLNDFAVNARVYEGMGFDWLDRAEEIAVLTVLQTEFPRLAADLEREPALMRFLYREETPTRASLVSLVRNYSDPGVSDTQPLDEIVGGGDVSVVAAQLDENLARYLRFLRERQVPEPRADLIMMHSDGSLLAFDDPGIYHELLSAADTPRQDVVSALRGASSRDLCEAVHYVLEQSEKEPRTVAEELFVLAGEIAAELEVLDPDVARLLGGRLVPSMRTVSPRALEGYGAAVAAAFGDAELRRLLLTAEKRTETGVLGLIARVLERIDDEAWTIARWTMLPSLVPRAVFDPTLASSFFLKLAQDGSTSLPDQDVDALAIALTAASPEPVEAEGQSVAARKAAADEDAANRAIYEDQRLAYRGIAAELTTSWIDMPLGSSLRRDLLEVLRRVEGGEGFLELHDSLVTRDVERGQYEEANSLLLHAIASKPRMASRWVDFLSSDAPVSPGERRAALIAVIELIRTSSHEARREEASIAADKLAHLRSEDFDAGYIVGAIREELLSDWDEYSDSRFEVHLRLLSVVDSLLGHDSHTLEDRLRLYVDAVLMAQAESASVATIVRSIGSETPALARRIGDELVARRAWDEDNPEFALRALLAAHLRAVPDQPVAHVPLEAIMQVTDVKQRQTLAFDWISTAPPVVEVERLAGSHTLRHEAWRLFGVHSSLAQRADAWRLLVRKGAPEASLRALSAEGQPMEVYEEAAEAVRAASTVATRERAVQVFLTLPVTSAAADTVRGMVKVMAQDSKRTELALGVGLLRGYARELTPAAVRTLTPLVSRWAEEGEGHVSRRDLAWLVDNGFATKRSPLRAIVKALPRR